MVKKRYKKVLGIMIPTAPMEIRWTGQTRNGQFIGLRSVTNEDGETWTVMYMLRRGAAGVRWYQHTRFYPDAQVVLTGVKRIAKYRMGYLLDAVGRS